MKRRWLYLGPALALGLVAVACQGSPAANPTSAQPNGGAPSSSTSGSPLASAGVALAGEKASSYVLAAATGQQMGVWVSGEGKVRVVPDVALVNLGIEVQATTVAEANRKASDAMNAVMATLRQAGIADKDIQTNYFNISPQTRWVEDRIKGGGHTEIIGYTVSNQVTARIRDLAKVGSVIDAAATAAGDFTRIHGISFTVDNTALAINQAREAAVKDAMAKAQQMATVAGVALGKAVYISESQATPPPVYRAMFEAKAAFAAEAMAPTPISGGEQEVAVNVQMVFPIQ